MAYYNRYSSFRVDGNNQIVPKLTIDNESSDLYITFSKKTMRMDMLSYKYYGDANYGWLIMMANPIYGSLEYSIPDNVRMRIPYPLNSAINRYESAIKQYQYLNGND